MFFELLANLTTRCSPYVRNLGYLDETIAMRGRSRRRSRAWQFHLDRTRRFVLSSAKTCTGRSKALILGSGLLLDVPLAELSALFREVVLMDVVCLPEIRKRIRAFPSVRFEEFDATGVAEQLYRNGLAGRFELPEPPAPSLGLHPDADLVVSLNILSQLWVVPRGHVLRPGPWASSEQIDDWCSRIVRAHCDFLRGLSCDVCLIADHTFVKRDRDGNILSRGSTLYGVELAEPDESWTWQIARLGEESGFHSRELCVGAWRLERGASPKPAFGSPLR